MSVLEELYAQGGEDVILSTVVLSCDAWDSPVALVRDYVGHTITTENADVYQAMPCGMSVVLPKRDATGSQQLVFAIDGVAAQSKTLIMQAVSAGRQIELVYRSYLLSDLSQPAEAPHKLLVKSAKITNTKLEVAAGLFALIDMRWPRLVFDSTTAPCLKYVQ